MEGKEEDAVKKLRRIVNYVIGRHVLLTPKSCPQRALRAFGSLRLLDAGIFGTIQLIGLGIQAESVRYFCMRKTFVGSENSC